MTRTRDQINADLAEAARELQRITRSMKTLENGSATGTSVYRKLRDELPAAQERHAELAAELQGLGPLSCTGEAWRLRRRMATSRLARPIIVSRRG